MSSKGGSYAAQPPPRYSGDRFYNPPALRQHQSVLLQQQHQQLMQMQLLQQQQLMNQRQMQRRSGVGKAESSSNADVEKRREGDCLSKVVSMSVPPSIVASVSTSRISTLDRLMECVTPFVPAQKLSEGNSQVDMPSYFCLEDLWESFREWSAYGAGVPLWLNGKDPIDQYYVPSLSGIQLYIDPSKPSSQLSGTGRKSDVKSYSLATSGSSAATKPQSLTHSDMQLMDRLSLDNKSITNSSDSEAAKTPFFQHLEHEQPFIRMPLADKISILAAQNPELNSCKSCDLLPTSWLCVAWYPIYRIPVGPTLKDLEASFLTFHSLSTQSQSYFPAQFHAANTRKVNGFVDPTAKISLPVFGLASYKLKGSMVSLSGPQECEKEKALLQAAGDWLKKLQVDLRDYNFFLNSIYQRR